jgi:hypothetical protein
VLPVIWTLFAVAAVAGFIVIAAYWLDVRERPDLSPRARLAWSAGIVLFPVAIPGYAFLADPGWPAVLRIGAFVPAFALLLFAGFVTGLFV